MGARLRQNGLREAGLVHDRLSGRDLQTARPAHDHQPSHPGRPGGLHQRRVQRQKRPRGSVPSLGGTQAETTTSAPATSSVTFAVSEASAAVAVTPGTGDCPERLTARTWCPRADASVAMRLPIIPVAPKSTTFMEFSETRGQNPASRLASHRAGV